MQHNQSTILSATLGLIRDHIILGEEPIEHLYLDSKGNPTIGPGFRVFSENDFTKFNVNVTKNGKEVSASDAEKRQAYRQILTVRQNLINGKKNPNDNPFQNRTAISYETDTKTRMKRPAMNARLDRKIATRAGKIRGAVGGTAWNRLRPEQQAAAIDVGYNTGIGDLAEFPALRQAIIAGDAKAMARESLIFTDKDKGARNHERLSRNYEALSGLPKRDADRELAAILKNKGELARTKLKPDNEEIKKFPPFLKKALTEAAVEAEADSLGQAAKPPAAGQAADPEDSNFLGDGPMASMQDQPDGAGEQKAQAKKRSAMVADLTRPDGELDDILAKPPADLTQGEARIVMRARMALPSGPEQRSLEAFERAFFENAFGTGPARLDATGRMADEGPREPFPTKPLPATTPDGEPLTQGVRRVAEAIARDSERGGKGDAIKALQTGLNMVWRDRPALRVDGIAGPRTRACRPYSDSLRSVFRPAR